MVARVKTVAFRGIDAVPVDVQVMVQPGQQVMNIVGLPDKAVAESRERVRAALHASGLSVPPKRVTVNLAPADLPKEGSHYDLPIAVGLMAALGAIPADIIDDYVVIGELSLDGTLTRIAGALPAAIGANAMERGLICPADCGPEAVWAGADIDVLAPTSLIGLANHFRGTQVLSRPIASMKTSVGSIPDLSDIKGQETARRALEIAASGAHNLLLVGPPGAGKSMLAERLPGILPPLEPSELLEVSMISSIAGNLAVGGISGQRPFRCPHHSATMAAMVGGGMRAHPGEVSLAHNGVLFLDELPEFSPQVLDSLRQPLESGRSVIARANHRVTYPSRFQLVAAMNPCRCGMAGEPGHTCKRGARCATDYQARLSGPFLDRLQMRIDVPALTAVDMISPAATEASKDVAKRVSLARGLQLDRYRGAGVNNTTNAGASGKLIEIVAAPDEKGMKLLRQSAERLQLSARGYHRVLKVARTIADLESSPIVGRLHIAEAIAYRSISERVSSAA